MPPKSSRTSSRPATRETTPIEGWNPSRLRSGSQARTTPGPSRTRQASTTPTPSNVSQASKRAHPPIAITARIGGSSHAYGKGPRQVASNVVATAKQISFGSALEEVLDEDAPASLSAEPDVVANDEKAKRSSQLPGGQSVQSSTSHLVSSTRELSSLRGKITPLTRAAVQVSNESGNDLNLDDSNNTPKSHNETFKDNHEAGLQSTSEEDQTSIAARTESTDTLHVAPSASRLERRPDVHSHTRRQAAPRRSIVFQAPQLFTSGQPSSRWYHILWHQLGDLTSMIHPYLLILLPLLVALLWLMPLAQAVFGPFKQTVAGTISKLLCNIKDVDLSTGTINTDIFKDVLAKMERTEIKLRNLENVFETRKPERSVVQQVNHFSPNIGAQVLQHLTSPTMLTATERRPGFFRQLFFAPDQLPAINALTPWTEAGQAWCAAASDTGLGLAQLGVRTANTIIANSVTIEHVPDAATLDIKTAPKELEIWGKAEPGYGVLDTFDHICNQDSPGEDFICLGKVKYDIKKPNHVQTSALVNKNVPASTFVIRVVANHGRHYSCLYRVQMHGDVVKSKN